MGTHAGGGYTLSPSGSERIRENIGRLGRALVSDERGGLAPTADFARQCAESPTSALRSIFNGLGRGGFQRALPHECGEIKWFDDGTHVVYRLGARRDGQPIVEMVGPLGDYQCPVLGRTGTMSTSPTLLASADIERLRGLIGGSWRYLAGKTLTHHLCTPIDVIVGTTHGSLRVVSTAAGWDPVRDAWSPALLSISEDVGNPSEVERSGNTYFHHQHETLIEILIIRETITQLRADVETWSQVADIGVIFVLTDGVIAVLQASRHTEFLTVQIATSLAELRLHGHAGEWEDDLFVENRSQLNLISIEPRPETDAP